jgi:hypothetical protein
MQMPVMAKGVFIARFIASKGIFRQGAKNRRQIVQGCRKMNQPVPHSLAIRTSLSIAAQSLGDRIGFDRICHEFD